MEKQKKKHECPYDNCNASYDKSGALKIHVRKHNGERPFACNVDGCNKTFTSTNHLKRHKKLTHEKCEELTCIECNMVLNNKYALKKHQNRKHNRTEYPFYCIVCSQGFLWNKHLQKHLKYVHKGEPIFKCEICDLSFVQKYEYNRHKVYHKREACPRPKKIHMCKICNKNFSTGSNLNEHLKIHRDNEEKDLFSCPFEDCERLYLYKKNLNAHIHSFHEKKNDNVSIPCFIEGCSTILKSKKNLKQHLIRIHQIQSTASVVKMSMEKEVSVEKCEFPLSDTNSFIDEHKCILKDDLNVCERKILPQKSENDVIKNEIFLDILVKQEL